jgi:hypothetical protein
VLDGRERRAIFPFLIDEPRLRVPINKQPIAAATRKRATATQACGALAKIDTLPKLHQVWPSLGQRQQG